MNAAVIVAGGGGRRMQSAVKKQYLTLDGRPILAHTLLAFDRCPNLDRIVLVVPPEDLDMCRVKLVAALSLVHPIHLVAGGNRRQASVCNGLEAVGDAEGVVMIHDGVRPFVRSALIDACLTNAVTTGACIPALQVIDTIKQVTAEGVIIATLDRRTIRLAQTPQTFSINLIRRAHRLAVQCDFIATDDASVAEFAGETVAVVPGDPDNIKITTPQDLVVARAIMQRWKGEGLSL